MKDGKKKTVYFDQATNRLIETKAARSNRSFSEEVCYLCKRAIQLDDEHDYVPFIHQILADERQLILDQVQIKSRIAAEESADRVIEFIALELDSRDGKL